MLQAKSSRSATWARSLLRVAVLCLAALVAFILVKIIVDGWDEIAANYHSVDYRFLALSFLLGQLNVATLLLLWWGLLRQVTNGGGLPLGAAARIFASAWLGRYLPGRIWTAAGKVYLGRQLGAEVHHLSISVFFELTLSVVAQATVALILILLFFDGFVLGSGYEIYVVAALVALIMLAIHPAIFWRLVNRLVVRLGRQPVDSADFLSYPAIMAFFCLYGLQVLIMGACLLSFTRAVTPLDGPLALFVLASFIAANLVGRVAFVAPVGIGFREGALTALLQFKLALALASLITVLSRVWLVFIDVTFVAIVFLAGRIGGTRPSPERRR
jgi:glycosyltransferase 2 family protein